MRDDFTPIITTPAKGENTIEDIKALPGRTLNSKITFSVGEQYKHFFEDIDFEFPLISVFIIRRQNKLTAC